ncbi:MAG: peptidyl-prolyl cis-trans isomerase [Myxococcales bacterium]|jgi:peptidyl-prolyl cis-trans isomerase C
MRPALSPAALCLGLTLACCAAPVRAEQNAARRAQVVARFEGGQITVGDVEDAIANKAPHIRERLATPEGKRSLLREMIDYELLLAEARRRGYARHPVVRDAVTGAALQRLQEQLALQHGPDSLPAADVEAYYEAHRDVLSVPALRRASYVVLSNRAEAEALRKRAASMPLPEFRRLAARMDESGRGGELGYVDASGHAGGNADSEPRQPALAKLAFSLPGVGALSEPRPHGDGWVVLRVTAVSPAKGARLADVEATVRERLARDRAAQAFEALVARLREEHGVQTRPELSDAMPFDPGEPPDIPAGFSAAPPDPTAPTIIVEDDGV